MTAMSRLVGAILLGYSWLGLFRVYWDGQLALSALLLTIGVQIRGHRRRLSYELGCPKRPNPCNPQPKRPEGTLKGPHVCLAKLKPGAHYGPKWETVSAPNQSMGPHVHGQASTRCTPWSRTFPNQNNSRQFPRGPHGLGQQIVSASIGTKAVSKP